MRLHSYQVTRKKMYKHFEDLDSVEFYDLKFRTSYIPKKHDSWK